MPYHKNELTDTDKLEIVQLYTAKFSLIKIAEKYKVATQQIMETLDEAGIPRKKNKKQIATGWKPTDKRPDTITVTKATDEYMEYLMNIMAQAGRMDGEATTNMERLMKANPYVGKKRETITKHRK